MTAVSPFSRALRDRSTHAQAGGGRDDFMSDLVAGAGTRDDYIALVAQHWFVYAALEAVTARMRHDPVAAVFISDKLTRLPALEADLDFLVGADWRDRIRPLETTRLYVERIERVGATWPGGFVAHHYTRYLGDLSGGQYLRRVMARHFGFETNGIGFLLFDDIADPKAFKDVYREQLDAAPWDAAEQARVLDEVLLAHRCNTDLLAGLARAKADTAA